MLLNQYIIFSCGLINIRETECNFFYIRKINQWMIATRLNEVFPNTFSSSSTPMSSDTLTQCMCAQFSHFKHFNTWLMFTSSNEPNYFSAFIKQCPCVFHIMTSKVNLSCEYMACYSFLLVSEAEPVCCRRSSASILTGLWWDALYPCIHHLEIKRSFL